MFGWYPKGLNLYLALIEKKIGADLNMRKQWFVVKLRGFLGNMAT